MAMNFNHSVSILALSALVAACGGGDGDGVTYTVGGTISGLTGTVVLESGGMSRSFTTNGTQTLTNPIPEGTAYAVSVRTQPAGQICTVSNGSGTVRANVTNVLVTCTAAIRTYTTVSTLTLSSPPTYAEGIAADAAGNLYVADMLAHRILKITSTGTVSTLAGSGISGQSNGNGTGASFSFPDSVAVDASGNVYVADTSNHMIRKISPSGEVTTLAGSTTPGSTNGMGAAASFRNPSGITTDASGNVYVADGGNNMIRKITPTGVVTTLAGIGTSGSADSQQGTNASFNFPRGIAVDTSGNVFVSDTRNNMIRKIDTTGTVTTVAGTTADGSANGTGSAASFSRPHGLTIDAAGNLFVADAGGLVRKVTPAGEVSTLAGILSSTDRIDGASSVATFLYMHGVTIDASGVLYVIEPDRVRKIE